MITLQIIWFVLVGLLFTGYAILDGFDLGVGFWHLFTKSDEDRRFLIRSIGPVWDGNEVWLITGGGALFAAFPPVYATVFSGFYLPLILVLMGLIFRAVGIEVRSKVEDTGWRKKWDVAFSLGSIVPALLFGVVLGNIARGIELDASGNYVGGFFALLNPYALLVGLTGLAMFAVHGAIYLAMKSEGDLYRRVKSWGDKAWYVYLGLFSIVSLWSLIAYQRGSMALAIVAALLALAGIVGIKFFSKKGADGKAFISSSVSIAALFGAVAATVFPNVVPALTNESLSLTLYNSSSSQMTLTVMLIIALVGMPLVIGYTAYIYKTFAGKITADDLDY